MADQHRQTEAAGSLSTGARFDVAIIGAGVVGCAMFRAFVLAGARCILIEKDTDIISGSSKANSAILHTGFDADPGSLESRCMKAGYRIYVDIHADLNLPLLRTGALLVAWNAGELAQLPAIVARAQANGVTDVRQVVAEEVREREPKLSSQAQGGVVVPGEALIDPWSAPLAYALQGLANGGKLLRETEVFGGELQDGVWQLRTRTEAAGAGRIEARVVVNCAGLYGDLVEAIARPSPFSIRPRKGQFVVFDKPARALVDEIILPVPTERTKGIVITPTVYGNLLVGPTAEDQDERRVATVESSTLEALINDGERMLPGLARQSITTAYAGLRPATASKDYIVEAVPDRNWITASGIRSTGLTGSLGIAEHVLALHDAHFGGFPHPIAPVTWPKLPNLAEARPRPWQEEPRGEIVCHCENVTGTEIEAAFAGPLPVRSLGGLRRRTRCMLGRCQGFYCTRRVMEIAAAHIPGLVEPPQTRREAVGAQSSVY